MISVLNLVVLVDGPAGHGCFFFSQLPKCVCQVLLRGNQTFYRILDKITTLNIKQRHS